METKIKHERSGINMGAWGSEVFENDSACDFMCNIEKSIEKLVRKKKLVFDHADIRASAEVVIKMSSIYHFNEYMLESLKEKLELILNDKQWIDSWIDSKDRSYVKSDLSRQIREIGKLI
jgi:hypothetical protein